ncbi:MAG: threonine synthase [Planctomycetota bacterium]
MHLSFLECNECDKWLTTREVHGVCPDCGMPLEARYDLEGVAVTPAELELRTDGSMWRFREVLPLREPAEAVTLGEGDTPLLQLPRLGAHLGLARLSVKDEAKNPTGSFKARGMSVAVSMARQLGATALAAPSAGNAGGALAAYGARAGLPVHLAMPKDVPEANLLEAEICGAKVELIDGNIRDCGAWLAEAARQHGWYDLSTLKEPYRVEGKKTMGYEIAMQLGWSLPDVILYPTGGGTGLVGIWKAFQELRQLGWLAEDSRLPRMVAVQAEDCAPIVDAFHAGAEGAKAPGDPRTVAAGIRVPAPIGDRWMLRVLRESEGTAVAVSDQELLAGTRLLARKEGLFTAPEAGALVAAAHKLALNGSLREPERVLLILTGTGLKYLPSFR